MKKVFIVVGLGYGDEGKGIATDFLSYKNSNSIVVRFNGGHQAGHCVVNKIGEKHIFSNLYVFKLNWTFYNKFLRSI